MAKRLLKIRDWHDSHGKKPAAVIVQQDRPPTPIS
jgi:hypothetical protein